MDTLNQIEIDGKLYDVSSPTSTKFRDLYIKSFGDSPFGNISINTTNIEGFRVELHCPETKVYRVKIYDDKDNLVYESDMENNWYSKLSRKYYSKWKTKIYDNGELVLEDEFSLNGKRVFIVMDSSSLGDSLAWMPYCEVFAKKHNCKVIVSSFRNELFKSQYPEIEFVTPGSVVNNIHALYKLGWFYNHEMEPEYPNTIPLQKTACNILGLNYEEIHSKIYFEPKQRPYKEKYICIATNSTAGCKLWNNPDGWKQLSNYLKTKGYRVINISKDGDLVDGVDNIIDDSLDNTMNVIYHSEFVIGLSSGLSWLSWSLGKHVVMISNFTEPNHEFTTNCTRIFNHSVCNSCWNNPMFKFDKGDWNWCPEHKGTDRQFECHKSISTEMVLEQIQHLL